MIELAYPWMLFLLPLPLLVYFLLPAFITQSDAVQVPFFRRVANADKQAIHNNKTVLDRLWLQRIALVLAWLLLLLAMAKPQLLGDAVIEKKSARDLMVLVDLSGSMDTQDFRLNDQAISRAAAVKAVLADFIKGRKHDRLGLIVFADAAFLQVPFTEDHKTWLSLLNELETGMAGQRTMLGDAIGLAIKLFSSDADQAAGLPTMAGEKQRVVILLTDGNDTGSKVPPIEAAKIAADKSITLYTIAIGDPETIGEEALDSQSLKRMAEITGGKYYQALDLTELKKISADINALQPEIFQTQSFRPATSLHFYLLIPLFIFYSLFHALLLFRQYQQFKKLQQATASVKGLGDV